jgi:hypothetical protein
MTLALHTLTSLIRRKAVVALLTMLTLAGAIGANVARAEIAVPYHTIPQAAPPVIKYADGSCLFNFYNPSVVLGFVSNEYVYWRPIGAFVASNAWQYRYGEWRRALTSTTKMIYGWESQQWPTNAWAFSNGVSGVLMPPGTNRWLGYQIFYSSKSYTFTEWRGAVPC